MIDQLISFETAKLAKEKNFTGDCIYYYTIKKGELRPFMFDKSPNVVTITNWNDYPLLVLAPTQSLLQKWLREKHNLFIYCVPTYDEKKWYFYINNLPIIKQPKEEYNSYEEALEIGLQEALKLIK